MHLERNFLITFEILIQSKWNFASVDQIWIGISGKCFRMIDDVIATCHWKMPYQKLYYWRRKWGRHHSPNKKGKIGRYTFIFILQPISYRNCALLPWVCWVPDSNYEQCAVKLGFFVLYRYASRLKTRTTVNTAIFHTRLLFRIRHTKY